MSFFYFCRFIFLPNWRPWLAAKLSRIQKINWKGQHEFFSSRCRWRCYINIETYCFSLTWNEYFIMRYRIMLQTLQIPLTCKFAISPVIAFYAPCSTLIKKKKNFSKILDSKPFCQISENRLIILPSKSIKGLKCKSLLNKK